MENLNFVNGKAIVKRGRKIVAKVYNRPVFFKDLKVSWNEKFPYSVEIFGMAKECVSLDECIEAIKKYC